MWCLRRRVPCGRPQSRVNSAVQANERLTAPTLRRKLSRNREPVKLFNGFLFMFAIYLIKSL